MELLVRARGGVDLRSWHLTDNDTRDGDAEGTLVFPESEVLSRCAVRHSDPDRGYGDAWQCRGVSADDLDARDGTLVLYVGNGTLDT